MGFRCCGFEERLGIKEADLGLLEPIKRLIAVSEDRLSREEVMDDLGRKCLYLEVINGLDHFLYAIFDVPSDVLEFGLFVYRMRLGEHDLPLEIPDCVLLPKSSESEFVTNETCYRLRGIAPKTFVEAARDIGDGAVIPEQKWDEANERAQYLLREGYI